MALSTAATQSAPGAPQNSPLPIGGGSMIRDLNTVVGAPQGLRGPVAAGVGAQISPTGAPAAAETPKYAMTEYDPRLDAYDYRQIWDKWSTGDWKVPGQGILNFQNQAKLTPAQVNQNTWSWYQDTLKSAMAPPTSDQQRVTGQKSGLDADVATRFNILKQVADALKTPVDKLPIGAAIIARDAYLRQSEATRRRHEGGIGPIGNILSLALFALNPGLGAFAKMLGGQVAGAVLPRVINKINPPEKGNIDPNFAKPGKTSSGKSGAQAAIDAMKPTGPSNSTKSSISATRQSSGNPSTRSLNPGGRALSGLSNRTGVGRKKYKDIFGTE